MTATIEFTQFRKFSGNNVGVTPVRMDKVDEGGGLAFGFFGLPGSNGYISPPSAANAQLYRVKAGSASWQVWTAVKVGGYAFTLINNIRIFVDAYAESGLGSIAGQDENPIRLLQGTDVAISGVFMRVVPGTIEMGIPPEPLEAVIPSSAPAFGLPVPVDGGWTLLKEYTQQDGYIDIEEASDTVQPNSADVTPFREQSGQNEIRAIYASDQETRYSNFCVMNFVCANDATAGVQYPADLGVTWNES